MARKKDAWERRTAKLKKEYAWRSKLLAETEEALRQFSHLPNDGKVPLLRLRRDLVKDQEDCFEEVASAIDSEEELEAWFEEIGIF